MDKFENVDLRKINNLQHYLTQFVVDDTQYNFDHKAEYEEHLDQIRSFTESFIEGLDLRQYHQIRDRYREYKNGESSLHMVLGYRRREFLSLLETFREEYAVAAQERLFKKVISEMTGGELNEYLLLIGLVK